MSDLVPAALTAASSVTRATQLRVTTAFVYIVAYLATLAWAAATGARPAGAAA